MGVLVKDSSEILQSTTPIRKDGESQVQGSEGGTVSATEDL